MLPTDARLQVEICGGKTANLPTDWPSRLPSPQNSPLWSAALSLERRPASFSGSAAQLALRTRGRGGNKRKAEPGRFSCHSRSELRFLYLRVQWSKTNQPKDLGEEGALFLLLLLAPPGLPEPFFCSSFDFLCLHLFHFFGLSVPTKAQRCGGSLQAPPPFIRGNIQPLYFMTRRCQGNRSKKT